MLFGELKREFEIRIEVLGKGRSVGGRRKPLIGRNEWREKTEWEEEVNNIYEIGKLQPYNESHERFGFEDVVVPVMVLVSSIHRRQDYFF